MTAARVQEVGSAGTAGAQTGVTITLSGITTTVGNHLIVCVSTNVLLGAAAFSISDSKSNTWQKDANAQDTSSTVQTFSAKLTSALVNADTITISWSPTSSTGAATAAEYSGLASSSWLDKTASASGASATASDSGATATTSQANELLIGALAPAGTITGFTPEVLSPAWSANTSAVPSSGNVRGIYPMYRVVSAAAAYNAKATWSTSRAWAQVIATYKAAALTGFPHSQSVVT